MWDKQFNLLLIYVYFLSMYLGPGDTHTQRVRERALTHLF